MGKIKMYNFTRVIMRALIRFYEYPHSEDDIDRIIDKASYDIYYPDEDKFVRKTVKEIISKKKELDIIANRYFGKWVEGSDKEFLRMSIYELVFADNPTIRDIRELEKIAVFYSSLYRSHILTNAWEAIFKDRSQLAEGLSSINSDEVELPMDINVARILKNATLLELRLQNDTDEQKEENPTKKEAFVNDSEKAYVAMFLATLYQLDRQVNSEHFSNYQNVMKMIDDELPLGKIQSGKLDDISKTIFKIYTDSYQYPPFSNLSKEDRQGLELPLLIVSLISNHRFAISNFLGKFGCNLDEFLSEDYEPAKDMLIDSEEIIKMREHFARSGIYWGLEKSLKEVLPIFPRKPKPKTR